MGEEVGGEEKKCEDVGSCEEIEGGGCKIGGSKMLRVSMKGIG